MGRRGGRLTNLRPNIIGEEIMNKEALYLYINKVEYFKIKVKTIPEKVT